MTDKTIQDILYLLGAWERGAYAEEYSTQIDSLRQALAQPEQEPVAWLHPDKKVDVVVPSSLAWFDKPIPLYTAPPKREWVGMTDEEIENCFDESCYLKQVDQKYGIKGTLKIHDVARAIEAKLREKNNA